MCCQCCATEDLAIWSMSDKCRACFEQQAGEAPPRRRAVVARRRCQAVGGCGGVVLPQAAHVSPRKRRHLHTRC